MSERDAIADSTFQTVTVAIGENVYLAQGDGLIVLTRAGAEQLRQALPAEPEEVSEEMIEAGAEALWDTFRQTDLCTGPTAKATTWYELLVVARTSEAAALQVRVGRMEARASFLAMRAADKKGDA